MMQCMMRCACGGVLMHSKRLVGKCRDEATLQTQKLLVINVYSAS